MNNASFYLEDFSLQDYLKLSSAAKKIINDYSSNFLEIINLSNVKFEQFKNIDVFNLKVILENSPVVVKAITEENITLKDIVDLELSRKKVFFSFGVCKGRPTFEDVNKLDSYKIELSLKYYNIIFGILRIVNRDTFLEVRFSDLIDLKPDLLDLLNLYECNIIASLAQENLKFSNISATDSQNMYKLEEFLKEYDADDNIIDFDRFLELRYPVLK